MAQQHKQGVATGKQQPPATRQNQEDTKLATKTNSAIAGGDMPDYLRKPSNVPAAGLENMERADMTLPRLGLCQAMSPQRKKTDPKYVAGLEEGLFFNTISRKVYGDGLNIVPLLFFKTRIRFGSGIGTALLCQSQDAKTGTGDPGGECAICPMAQFKPDGGRPECSAFFNYAAVVLEEDAGLSFDNLVVVSFKSTGLKVARDWNSLIRIRRADMFAGIYHLRSVTQKNDKGEWYVPVVEPAGWVSQAMYRDAALAYSAVAELNNERRLRVDIEDLTPETTEQEMA